MTNVKAETSSRQVASSPHCTPTSCAVKGVSTASDLSPDTEAMLDHLLSPTNLPPSPCSPTPPAVLTSTAHGLSPETEAVLDYLLSPTNLPRTPYSAMAPAVITSPGHMTPTARPLNQVHIWKLSCVCMQMQCALLGSVFTACISSCVLRSCYCQEPC